MQKNPYLILGLSNEATKEEIENAYRRLRDEYQQLRFEEGEIGANASRKLDEIEVAYHDCMEDLRSKDVVSSYGSSYGEVESLIKQRRLEQAQIALDSIDVRDGEWHYYQAQIFYHNGNVEGAKQQLEIASDLEPFNDRYRKALDRIVGRQNNQQNNQQNQQQNQYQGNNDQRAGYSRPTGAPQQDNANACCAACQGLICADCCCECCGGDLIACC